MKGQAFCPRCGKTDELLSGGLCLSCFLEDFRLISVPDVINLTICTQCGSIQKKSRWYDSHLTIEEKAAETIIEHVEESKSVVDVHITLELENVRGSTLEYVLSVIGKVQGRELSQEYLVKVEVNKSVCNECSKYASGYYEAVIQLRADNRVLTSVEIASADDILRKRLEKLSQNNRMAYITQRAEIKEGVDYYIGSLKAARKLTDFLKNSLGGVVNESPRLMGHDKSAGKDLYRIWILLRLPEFQRGDFVRYNETFTEVKNFDGNKIYLEALDSGQHLSIPWKTSSQLEIVAHKEDVTKALVSAKTPDYIQILHPETYQPLDIPITPGFLDIKIGEEVLVVDIDGNFYMLKE
ncbi:MAG TPA: 60S ribosomal export protein NMD3 [Methanobacterium sp.]|nr:60S ribosomal export protein NMD3 [Methanobacterium sp.]